MADNWTAGMDYEVDLGNGESYPSRYEEISTRIDIGNLNGEFVSHPEKYGYISYLAREAEIRHDAAKKDFETLEAQLDDEVRGKLTAIKEQNEKFKVTETVVKNQVRADPRFIKQQALVTNLAALQKRLNGARETLIERRHALISLAANVRDTGGPMRMNESPVEERKERARANAQRVAEAGGFPNLPAAAPSMPPVGPVDEPAPEPEDAPAPVPQPARGRRKPVE